MIFFPSWYLVFVMFMVTNSENKTAVVTSGTQGKLRNIHVYALCFYVSYVFHFGHELPWTPHYRQSSFFVKFAKKIICKTPYVCSGAKRLKNMVGLAYIHL